MYVSRVVGNVNGERRASGRFLLFADFDFLSI